MDDLLIRGTGLLSLGFILVAMYAKNKNLSVLGLAIGSSILVAHLWLLGSQAGSLLAGLDATRLVLWLLIARGRDTIQIYVFTALYAIAFWFTFDGYQSVLVMAGTLLSAWSVAKLQREQLKYGLIAANAAWLSFDLSVGAYEVAFGSALGIMLAFKAAQEIKKTRKKQLAFLEAEIQKRFSLSS